MFKEYESKPVKRNAAVIESAEDVIHLGGADYMYNEVKFKAYELPATGDYIVRLSEDDTYHCTAEVFAERNVVPE